MEQKQDAGDQKEESCFQKIQRKTGVWKIIKVRVAREEEKKRVCGVYRHHPEGVRTPEAGDTQ